MSVQLGFENKIKGYQRKTVDFLTSSQESQYASSVNMSAILFVDRLVNFLDEILVASAKKMEEFGGIPLR